MYVYENLITYFIFNGNIYHVQIIGQMCVYMCAHGHTCRYIYIHIHVYVCIKSSDNSYNHLIIIYLISNTELY